MLITVSRVRLSPANPVLTMSSSQIGIPNLLLSSCSILATHSVTTSLELIDKVETGDNIIDFLTLVEELTKKRDLPNKDNSSI